MSATIQTATEARTGKGYRDENFPVASHLIHPRHRGAILAFYDFVRAGDDVADHTGLAAERKLELLDALADDLTGTRPTDSAAEPLRRELSARGLAPTHALELLDAFRLDARKNRYADWDELIAYCRLSAMPVGRYVLDVHGEDRSVVWGPSDAICAALQIINHLQDCGKDYRGIDRVYIPQDAMNRHGAATSELAADKASPALRAVIRELAERTMLLLDEGAVLPDLIADLRLSLEIAAIHRLAVVLCKGLMERDPLSEKVHHGKAAFALTALGGIAQTLARRPLRGRTLRAQARKTAQPRETGQGDRP